MTSKTLKKKNAIKHENRCFISLGIILTMIKTYKTTLEGTVNWGFYSHIHLTLKTEFCVPRIFVLFQHIDINIIIIFH